jgi:hypothetical protein
MAKEYEWQICPAKGCGKKHRRLLKWCSTHEKHLQRNGHPTEYRVKFQDLNQWRPEVSTMLNRWAADPAIIAGLELMQDILHHHGLNGDGASVGRAARPYLDKLIIHGAGARSCLIEMASLAFYYASRKDWPDEAVQVMAFATRLLLSIPKAGNSKNSWRRKVIAALGFRIITDLRPLLVDMWVVYERTENKLQARRKLAGGFAKATAAEA